MKAYRIKYRRICYYPASGLLPLVIIFYLFISQLSAQEPQQEISHQDEYEILMHDLNHMEEHGRFEEARILLIKTKDHFPDKWFELAQELVYLNKKTERYFENLQLFKDGHEQGYFFFLSPRFPSCKPYLQYEEFQAIARQDLQLREEAIKRSELIWEVQLPEAYDERKNWPILFILHGGGSSIVQSKKHWQTDRFNNEFIVVYVQSYLHYASNSFGWKKHDPRAREELIRCYESLLKEYAIDTTAVGICGISAGATMAMDAFTADIFPINYVVAFSPSKPLDFNSQLSSLVLRNSKSVVILIGEDDSERRRKESEEMSESIDAAGINTYLEIIPGLGHDYPDNFSLWINYALANLFPDINTGQPRPLKVIKLEGSAYQIGYLHGRLLKEEIHEIIRRWKALLIKEYGFPPEVCIGKFFSATSYLHYVHRHARELVNEIRGIADGAGIQFRTMLAFQMSEEFEIQGRNLLDQKCTAIAIQAGKGNPTTVSQNMDPPLFLHGFPTLLKIKNTDTGLEAMVFTVPGLIGLNGLSRNGIAVCCNGISMLNSDTAGMPVAFVMRSLLGKEDVNEAASFLDSVTHATPQAYTLGDHNRVICFECSANECKPYTTFQDDGVVLHTNFSVVNRDFNEHFISLLAEYGKTVDDPYYCPRFFMLYDIIQQGMDAIDISFLKNTLRMRAPEEHPVLNEYTYGTSIITMGEHSTLIICAGNEEDHFIHLSFKE